MEKYNLESDIKVLYVEAKSFPEGVMEAHNQIQSIIPYNQKRRHFGISSPDRNGKISYKAAVEELFEDEAENYDCKSFTIQNGEFITLTVSDFMNDIPGIGQAFQKLLAYPDIDHNGYCLEWYINEKDVLCMVKLN